MLGTLTMGLTIDAFGPILDNAGDICGSENVPTILNAAENTMAEIGKVFLQLALRLLWVLSSSELPVSELTSLVWTFSTRGSSLACCLPP